jgi:hypothetical protein
LAEAYGYEPRGDNQGNKHYKNHLDYYAPLPYSKTASDQKHKLIRDIIRNSPYESGKYFTRKRPKSQTLSSFTSKITSPGYCML